MINIPEHIRKYLVLHFRAWQAGFWLEYDARHFRVSQRDVFKYVEVRDADNNVAAYQENKQSCWLGQCAGLFGQESA